MRVTGRNAQGVRLVNPADGDLVTAVARVVPDDTETDGVTAPEGGDAGPAADEAGA